MPGTRFKEQKQKKGARIEKRRKVQGGRAKEEKKGTRREKRIMRRASLETTESTEEKR